MAGAGGLIFAISAAILIGSILSRNRTAKSFAEVLAQEAVLRKQIQHLEQSISASEKEHSSLLAIAASRLESTPPPKKTPAQRLADLLSKNPRLQTLYLNAQKAGYAKTYGPLFQKLGLSSEQIAKFVDILSEHDAQSLDIKATARAQDLKPSDSAIATLMREANDQVQSELTDLLGDSGYSQFKDYDRVSSVQTLVSQFAGTVAFTTPLNPQQAEQLTVAMANADPRYQKGGSANSARVDWNVVDQEAQAILAPSQFAAWQQVDEPMGDSPSRWMAQFTRAFARAMQETQNN